MISYSQFIEKVKNSNPPLIKNYTLKIRFSTLQVMGIFMLFLYTTGILLYLNECKKDSSLLDGIGSTLFFFSFLCILGWIGWFFSIKNSKQEKRKPFSLYKSVRLFDSFAVLISLISWIIVFGFDIFPETIGSVFLVFVLLSALGYFLSPWRSRRIYKNTPLLRLLSILGLKLVVDDECPFKSINFYSYLSAPICLYFNIKNDEIFFGRTKCGTMHHRGQGGIEREYMAFSIPYSQKKNINDVIEIFKKFLDTTTGKDLSFHDPILEYSYAKSDDRIEILFVLHKGVLHAPNFYEDRYFYYNEDDIQQLYNDISDLHYSLENLFE